MTRIPKILHYTFGLAKDFGGQPWGLVHHACLRSAIERIAPEQVLFCYEYEPSGPWWELSRPFVTLVKIEAPREIFGRPLRHVAHRSDVVRLQQLIKHGGIYLDTDVLAQRNFDPLLSYGTVLGSEGVGAEFGLANAVILSEPESPFLKRWLDSYRSFRGGGKDEYWAEHSVHMPAALARAYPADIHVLPHTAFFWPMWTPEHLDWIFNSARPISLDDCYASHLWESCAGGFLRNLTPGRVRARNSNFHLWARPFVADLPDDFGEASIKQRLWSLSNKTINRSRERIKVRASRSLGTIVNEAKRLIPIDHRLRRRAFRKIYQRSLWGTDGKSRFFSGAGSRGAAAEFYVGKMADLLALHSRDLGRPITVVDIGCGDFEVGRALVDRLPDLTYIGCDIVPELIARNSVAHGGGRVSFRQFDVVCDPLPEGDVCLIRQVFQHLPNADILAAINRLPYPLAYVTEAQPPQRIGPLNPDKAAGADVRFNWRLGQGRGVELNQPPYGLNTEEVFRVPLPPGEIIVTERVELPLAASVLRANSAAGL